MSPHADINCVHCRLGHPHHDGIKQLFKQEDLSLHDLHAFSHCKPCALATLSMRICRMPHTRVEHAFQKIDLCGKTIVIGVGNKSYYLVITDDYSWHRWSTCLSTKDQVVATIKQFFKLVETQYRHSIVELHYDNGTEFSSTDFLAFIDTQGCKVVLTAPYHHSQNGIVECAIGLITSHARTMMLGTRLPPQLWPEAVGVAIYISNHVPTFVNPKGQTPISQLEPSSASSTSLFL